MQQFGVIGAGAWGSALAQALRRAERDVMIWARRDDVANAINKEHMNDVYLPEISLDPAIKATTNIAEVAAFADVLLIVTPAQHTRSTLENLKPYIKEHVPLVICCKGIETSTGLLMSQVVQQVLPDQEYALLSGPNFADEVAMGLPAACTISSIEKNTRKSLAEAMASKYFRPYISSDPISAEIGGAVKNVIAIACGIVYGRELGENARCAMITRGLAEMARLATSMGGKRKTLMGMSGVGDLTLTCSSMKSRNFSLGVMRGRGESLNEILAKRHSVTEGISTASAVLRLAKKQAIDMPICEAVDAALNKNISIDEAIQMLLDRPLQPEWS